MYARDPDVLVVENDTPLRDALSDLLRDDGYAVTEVPDPEYALALLTDSAISFVAVVLDRDAFGLTCRQMLPVLRRHVPDLPVVVVSSDLDPTASETVGADGRAVFLVKPFRAATLERAVAGLIGGPAARPPGRTTTCPGRSTRGRCTPFSTA